MKKPNLFIVGKPKAGTTALYDMLYRHPQVFMSRRKEVGYFSNGGMNKKKYLQLFEEAENEKIVGEASTGYLCSKTAAKNISKFNSEAKIIAIFREPVEFVRSLYQQKFRGKGKKEKFDKKKFLKFVDNNRERLGYGKEVRRFLEKFPKENIKVIIYEDFKKDNLGVFKEVCEFLGVEKVDLKPRRRNRSRTVKHERILKFFKFLPTSKLRRYIEDFAGEKVAQLIEKAYFRLLFEEKKFKISSGIRKKLKREFKPEVKKVNKLLNQQELINKDLIKYWDYDRV